MSIDLNKVNESITINRYDNGYMVEISGQDKEETWITRKIICNNLQEVLTLVTEYSKLPLTN